VLVFIKTSAPDLIIRTVIDALFVTAGVWVAEAWSHKTEKAPAMKQITG